MIAVTQMFASKIGAAFPVNNLSPIVFLHIVYFLAEGNMDSRFSIDRRSGQVSCDPLDREEVDAYDLTIEARDGGQPVLSGIMYIHIDVSLAPIELISLLTYFA